MALAPPSLVQRRLPPAPAADSTAAPTVVLLHGRGADENDLLGLVPLLPRRCAYVSLRAPLRFPYGGFAWFEHDDEGHPDEASFARSLQALHAEIGPLRGTAKAAPRLAVVGFSQGAAMVAALLLTGARADGFGVLSGFLPASLAAADAGAVPAGAGATMQHVAADGGSRAVPAGAGTPPAKAPSAPPPAAFVGHGSQDPLVPVEAGRLLRTALEAAGARVTHREYEEGHAISADEADDLATWLQAVLFADGGQG